MKTVRRRIAASVPEDLFTKLEVIPWGDKSKLGEAFWRRVWLEIQRRGGNRKAAKQVVHLLDVGEMDIVGDTVNEAEGHHHTSPPEGGGTGAGGVDHDPGEPGVVGPSGQDQGEEEACRCE